MTRRPSENIFLPYFVFLLVSLLLLGLDKAKLISFLKYPLEIILVTPRKTLFLTKIRLGENWQIFFTKDLRLKVAQSDDYKKELDILKSKIQLLEEENNSLRKQLESPLPASWDFIPAYVLGKDRYLILDKGQNDGVSKNMVVVSETQVIGKINAVSPKTSQMMFLWDPELKTPAKTNKNVRGLLIGAFGNQIILSRVLQKESLNNMDLVLTSGEENFPPNLIVGKVEEVTARAEDVYKEARVIPLIDYDKLQNVFIISSY